MKILEDNTELINKVTAAGIEYGTKILTAIIVLIVGFWIIKRIVRFFEKILLKQNLDKSVSLYAAKIIRVILIVCLFISVASMVGIQTTSFIAILGAAGLAIGMALQGSLANFAGGFLILVLKPFEVGDYIMVDGVEGHVAVIDVFSTILTTLDNKRVIVPNGVVAGSKMVNVGKESNRRVDLSIGIGYGDDFNKAKQAIINMAKEDSKILTSPEEPFVGITDFGDSSVNLTVRVWCKTEDYWDVFFNTNQRLKECLDNNGISIPFPQRDVHLRQVATS